MFVVRQSDPAGSTFHESLPSLPLTGQHIPILPVTPSSALLDSHAPIACHHAVHGSRAPPLSSSTTTSSADLGSQVVPPPPLDSMAPRLPVLFDEYRPAQPSSLAPSPPTVPSSHAHAQEIGLRQATNQEVKRMTPPATLLKSRMTPSAILQDHRTRQPAKPRLEWRLGPGALIRRMLPSSLRSRVRMTTQRSVTKRRARVRCLAPSCPRRPEAAACPRENAVPRPASRARYCW